MSLSDSNIIKQLTPHTEAVNILLTEGIKINTNKIIPTDIDKIKFSLFHILDGYLDENIGGVKSMQKYIINHILYDNSVYYIIENNFHYSIYKLTYFLYYSNKTTAFLYFGTYGHASMLHIVKNKDSFDVTYINPGEGVIKNNPQYINNNTYCNMFNRMEVPNTHKLEFLYFIKIFIYYKYTPKISHSTLAMLDFHYCTEATIKYLIPKLCYDDTKFEDIYNDNTQKDTFDTMENNFYKNQLNIDIYNIHNIDKSKLGDPNIIYEKQKQPQPLYFRLGDIMINRITDHNNIPFNEINILICGNEYQIEDLFVPLKQTNTRLNNLYILNPIFRKQPIEKNNDTLNLLKVVNFNTDLDLPNVPFEPTKIDDLDFIYNENYVNINELIVTSNVNSIADISDISIINMNLVYENFIPYNMKLDIPDDFNIERMKMFFIDDMTDLSQWYEFMFNALKNKDANYRYLEEIFTKNKPQFGEKEQKFYDTSIRFMDMYRSTLNITHLNENIDNPKLIKYYEAGLDIFNFHLDTDRKELLYKLFKSGTCVYMSFLGTIIYNWLQKDKPERLLFIYNKLTISAYHILMQYFGSDINYQDYFSSLNYKILTNKLNDLGIIYSTSRFKMSYYLTTQAEDRIEYTNNLVNPINSYLELNVLPFSELIEIINKIRNNDNTDKSIIIEKYFNLMCDKKYPIFNIYEFIIIGFLWEYYFNKEKWDVIIKSTKTFIEGKYCHISSALFTIAKCRIDVTYNECAWIDNLLELVINFNKKYKLDDIELFNGYKFIDRNKPIELFGFIKALPSHRDNNYDIIKIFNYITTNNFNNNSYEINIYKPPIATLADLQNTDINIIYNNNYYLQMFNIFNMTTYLIKYYREIYENQETINIPNIDILALHCTFITNHYSFFSPFELDYIVINILKSYVLFDNNELECNEYLYNEEYDNFNNISVICSNIIQLLNVHNYKFYIINRGSPEYYIYLNSNINHSIERCDKNEPLLDTYYKYPFSLDYKFSDISRTVIINIGSELLNNFHKHFQKNELTAMNINTFLESFNNSIVSDIIINIDDNEIEYIYGDEKHSSQYSEITYDTINNNVYPLTCYLKDRKNIVYETYEHIIHILMRSNYMDGTNIMGKDKVIIIRKDIPGFHHNYTIQDPNTVMVDNMEYNIIHDVKIFPFLASMPRESLCLLNSTGGDYKMIMLFHTYEKDNIMKDFVITSEKHFMTDSYYCEFSIRSNYLLPRYDKNTFHILDKIYNNNKLHRIIKNFKPGSVANIDFGKLVIYKPIFFDSLYKIVLRQINDADTLYNDIMQLKITKSKMDLLTWSKMVDIKDDNTCATVCGNRKNILLYVDRIREILMKLNIYLCKKINFNNGTNMIEIMVNNITTLSLLMQVNIYRKNLLLLKNIVKGCDNLACYKVRQLNRAFSRKQIVLFDNIESYEGTIKFNNTVNITDILFEIIFSEIITTNQWEIYKNMLHDYKTKTRRVYQLMMGKGKSSVITPLLFLNLKLIHKRRVYIIVPEHLLNDTRATFSEYLDLISETPIIKTDSHLKRNMLYNEDYRNDVFLIDEFDSLYNPLQSNFNYVEMSDVIDTKILDKVFKICYGYYMNEININNNNTTKLRKYSLNYEIAQILLNDNYEKNITFGLSNESEYPFVIPYVRKDSPLEGSRFSMYLITLILTLKYMWDSKIQQFKLGEKDINFIFNNNKKLLRDLCQLCGIEYNDTYVDKILVQMILKENPIIPKSFLYEYYMFIFNISGVFKISSVIKNISFVDVINMNCHWMVGYSGTVNVSLNIPEEYPTLNKFELGIIEDKDERINVYRALTNTPTIKYINGPTSLFALFKDYDVLIDCAAILKDYENKDVAVILYIIKKTPVIYVTKNDIKMIFDGDTHRKYVETTIREKVVYYYDQRHIVGTNFVQPIILNGLVTIDKHSLRTNVAQAIYRMRKLNEGHTVTICYNDTDIRDSKGIYKMIKTNEDNFNRNIKPLLYLQYLKYFVRMKTNNYNEINLKPLYEYKIDNIDSIFDEKINQNLMGMTTFNHLNFNKTELKVIISLFKKLKSLSVDEQINLLFGKNNTEVQQETQTQTQINTQINNEMNKDYDLDFQIYPHVKINYNVYNIESDAVFDKLIHTKIEFSTNIKLLIPIHLMSILFHLSSGLVLIPIYKDNILTSFILDCMICCDEYINIYPLYNTRGQLINPQATSIISDPPLQHNFKTMFADNIYGTILEERTEYYINFHEIFNINPEIDEVQINIIRVNNADMTILVALYKLLSFAFKFTNNNPVLLHKFTESHKNIINMNLRKFSDDLDLGQRYADYLDTLYKRQYLSNTLNGDNVNDMHTRFPDYLLEITRYEEINNIRITFNFKYNIERP